MKSFRTLAIVAILTLILFYLGYQVLIPQMAANTLLDDEIPSYIPEKFHQPVQELRTSMDTALQQLPPLMAEQHISVDDLVLMTKETRTEDVIWVIEKLQENPDMEKEDVYTLVKGRMSNIPGNDILLRPAFDLLYSPGRVQRGLEFVSGSALPLEVTVELGRRTMIEILKERKQEIEDQLDRQPAGNH